MKAIRVSIVLRAPIEHVWAVVEPVERHVDWMADAVAIRFKTEQTRGIGTEFYCDTKVWKIRLVDEMAITSWIPQKEIGVTHTGLVTGIGVFTLETVDTDSTRFSWTETLTFPWWLGGQLGALVGGQIVMKAIWRRNLRELQRIVESTAP